MLSVWSTTEATLALAYRSLVTKLGAAEKFTPSHLDKPEVKELIEGASHYYMEGFFLTHGIESALKLAKQSAAAKKVS